MNQLALDLRNGTTTLNHLEKDLHIRITKKEEYVLLMYDQFASPRQHPYVIESRGLILDKDFNVVCQPFSRFFNLDEVESDKVELDFSKNIEVFEKLDGSIIKFWFDTYTGMWKIATNATIFAESPTMFKCTFFDLVLQTLGVKSLEEFNDLVYSLNIGNTYLFELQTPKNAIIVAQEEYKLTYLACRNNYTGEYKDGKPEVSTVKGIDFVKKLDFKNLDEVVNSSNEIDPVKLEGYIVYQDGIPKYKVKSPKYVDLHYKRSDISAKKIINMILENEHHEFLSYFPNDKLLFEPFILAFDYLLKMIDYETAKYMQFATSKELAMSVKDHAFKSHILNRYNKGKLAKESFDWLLHPNKHKLISMVEKTLYEKYNGIAPEYDTYIGDQNVKGK